MEVKCFGLQPRSEFACPLLIGLPTCAFLVRRRIDRAGWGPLGFIGEGPRMIVRFAKVFFGLLGGFDSTHERLLGTE